MILEPQKEIVEALLKPETYGLTQPVELVHSHIARLFFAGDFVYKLKRSLSFAYVDFSTPEKRRLACVREMKRSAVYAPQLVLGTKPIKKLPDGKIVIGGKAGEEIDTLVVMRRLKPEALLPNVIQNGGFDRFEAMDLAEQLADLHGKSKIFRKKWGPETVRRLILETQTHLLPFCGSLFDVQKLNGWVSFCLENLQAQAHLIAFRQKTGHVRKCHGELVLSNIALEKGRFLFFSPLEYDETLDCTDTLYDLACLLMDLEAAGQRRLVNILFNHYMAYMNDMEGFPLLSLYQSMHAMIRALFCAKKMRYYQGEQRKKERALAKHYFELGLHFSKKFPPVLIACGGLSGSGKSRVAREIGGFTDPAPGAVVLRDDIIRKQILGVAPHEKLPSQSVSPAFEKVVYDILRQQARTALSGGSCVILDALFYDPVERQSAELLAQELGVPFAGFWMEAPLDVRLKRIRSRLRNPSDVTDVAELERQATLKTGRVTWRKIDTAGPKEETVAKVAAVLKKRFKKMCFSK